MRIITTAVLGTAAVLGLVLAATTVHVPQAAAQQGSTNLQAQKKKPKKGVVFIKTKRFSSCSDWGKDKGWCSKNNKP